MARQELTNRQIVDIGKNIEHLAVLLVKYGAVGVMDDAAQDYAVLAACAINKDPSVPTLMRQVSRL